MQRGNSEAAKAPQVGIVLDAHSLSHFVRLVRGEGPPMARVPFGYRRKGDQWAIADDQAAVVRRIFAEFTALYAHAGLTEIAAGLNVDAIPTQRGGQWHASTVKYILGNVVYVGEAHPAIISREVYTQAQARLAALTMGPAR